MLTNQEDIEKHITCFYKMLFGAGPPRNLKLLPTFWSDRHILTMEEGASLVREFQEDEVKTTMLSLKSNSAPGPNHFGCWETGTEKQNFLPIPSNYCCYRSRDYH